MGAACCVASKDRTLVCGSPGEILHRQVRYSPSWSFRWDNRGRVAGEETSVTDRFEVKSGTTSENAFASEDGSLSNNFRSLAWQKSPVSEGNSGILRPPSSDQSISQNLVEVESIESPSISYPSPTKLSPSAPSLSSLPPSPLSSQSNLNPPNSTPSRWRNHSREYKSPTFSISEEPSSFPPLSWANDSTRGSTGGSIGGSSDTWSIPTRRERWSFDTENETLGFIRDKITKRHSRFPSLEIQTCSICARLLTERSSWGWTTQKIIATNELAVVSVLTCGHVYHAECLECMTPEINKYDPSCLVCTFGEKRAVKMAEKALRAELESRARKRSKNCAVDSDVNSEGGEGRGAKMSSTSSMKSSLGKPFLGRHFSFGSKGGRSLSENNSSGRRKGFFWARSSKV